MLSGKYGANCAAKIDAVVNASSSGANTLVAAVTGRRIVVVSAFFLAAGAVTGTLQSGAGGTALCGPVALPANGGFVLPFNPNGWFETTEGVLLNLNLGGAVQVGGVISYVLV